MFGVEFSNFLMDQTAIRLLWEMKEDQMYSFVKFKNSLVGPLEEEDSSTLTLLSLELGITGLAHLIKMDICKYL